MLSGCAIPQHVTLIYLDWLLKIMFIRAENIPQSVVANVQFVELCVFCFCDNIIIVYKCNVVELFLHLMYSCTKLHCIYVCELCSTSFHCSPLCYSCFHSQLCCETPSMY